MSLKMCSILAVGSSYSTNTISKSISSSQATMKWSKKFIKVTLEDAIGLLFPPNRIFCSTLTLLVRASVTAMISGTIWKSLPIRK